ncbi:MULTISPECIES: hypothetical protein [unclassified Streptomyces]|uniref:hypothetical protein n=1 Tax=unclassified Streptomyces TaxID=2593676 RepID=UPI001319CAE5|nr:MULTISPECIES: hypothetical protein [unclassified Streptomyces]MYX39032.1 hypothetical protein [Streptomyces sp. SID8377]
MLAGQGICRICADRDPATTEARFRQIAARHGWTIAGTYVNNRTPIEMTCAAGHACMPTPNKVLVGRGICSICAGLNSDEAELRFRTLSGQRGWTVIGRYVNAVTPVDMVCDSGHACAPRPNGVLQGHGACRLCAGKTWDAFYVVRNPAADAVKFGITSGDPRPRLSNHARVGYREVIRLHTGLPDTVAPDLERDLLAVLRDAGEVPIVGREYFQGHTLAAVLAFVDDRLAIPRPRAEQVPLW